MSSPSLGSRRRSYERFCAAAVQVWGVACKSGASRVRAAFAVVYAKVLLLARAEQRKCAVKDVCSAYVMPSSLLLCLLPLSHVTSSGCLSPWRGGAVSREVQWQIEMEAREVSGGGG